MRLQTEPEWLSVNGMPVTVPATGNRVLAERAAFVSMFDGVDLRQTINAAHPPSHLLEPVLRRNNWGAVLGQVRVGFFDFVRQTGQPAT